MKYPNGSESVLSPGPWQQLIKVKGCICPDGQPRTATITGAPDTYFSVPARVKVGRKSVSGFVVLSGGRPDRKEGFYFFPNFNGKNASVFRAKEAQDANRT